MLVLSLLTSQAEWEALQIKDHDWALENVEEELTGIGENTMIPATLNHRQ